METTEDVSENPEIPGWPKGSLGWYKEKFAFEIATLEPGKEADKLHAILQDLKKKTTGGV